MTERWLPVAGWEGVYEVSSFGRIKRVAPGKNARPGRVLTPVIVQGLSVVTLSDRGSQRAARRIYIATAVAEAFLGPKKTTVEVRHKDGKKANNHSSNLEYGPPSLDLPGETWKPVVGYEGWYEVSDHGRVRRTRPGRGVKTVGRFLRPHVNKGGDGYWSVCLCRDGTPVSRDVHRLVARAFIGPCPPGWEVNHKDGNHANNGLDNLEYMTPGDNTRHAYANGFIPRGSKRSQAKLKEAQVLEIRRLGGTVPHPVLAERFGVSPATIVSVVRRKNWKWLI